MQRSPTSGKGKTSLSTPISSATKAAVHTYTLVLRKQLAGTSVSVVDIVPPMVDTNLNRAGRDAARVGFRGVSVADSIATAVKRLDDGADVVFHGDAENVLARPRGESENGLLGPSW